jgi:hypothetical protein
VFLVGMMLCLTSCGPRMYDQASIRPYSREMPAMPAGTTPSKGRSVTLALKASETSKNPLPATKENIGDGRIYYGYYCLMCHGEKGDGDGPVGQSYIPKPADLSSPAVKALSDGQLYRKMLTGVGHDPVMIETVLPDHHWPLVLYVRTFAKSQ